MGVQVVCKGTSVYAGAAAPEFYVRIKRLHRSFDFTTVIEASSFLYVTYEDGTNAMWPVAIVDVVEEEIVLQHVFAADGSDVPTPELVGVMAYLAVPGGRLTLMRYQTVLQAKNKQEVADSTVLPCATTDAGK